MSRARFLWRGGEWVDVRDLGPRPPSRTPHIWSDLPAYKSPLGTGVIEGRAARREEMKRSNCREVAPDEWKGGYRNAAFCRKHGLEQTGDPLPKPQRMPTTIGPSVPGVTE